MAMDIDKLFDMFDCDGNGTIDKAELKLAMEKHGLHPAIKEIDWLVKKVDKNNNGAVDRDEFAELVALIKSNAYSAECGGAIKLLKLRNDDLNKYPTASAGWKRKQGLSGQHGGGVYKREGGGAGKGGPLSPRGKPKPKSFADLP